MILQSQRYFLKEERIAFGLAHDLVAQSGRHSHTADQIFDQRVALLARQRVQHQFTVAMAVICLGNLF